MVNRNIAEKSYKLKIFKFKLYQDPLQRRICFLIFVDSLEMMFLGINKLVNYSFIIQKQEGSILKKLKTVIRNILNSSIDVHSRRFISDLPGDGVKCIATFQPHCANMNFAEKAGMTEFFRKSHIKEGNLQ